MEGLSKCKTCKHWKNNQVALFLNPNKGFCTCRAMDYDFEDGGMALCFQNGQLDYFKLNGVLLVTSDKFGCVMHEKGGD